MNLNKKLFKFFRSFHSFEIHSYLLPTNCDCCKGLLMGLIKQGLQCTQCSYNVHERCRDKCVKRCVRQSVIGNGHNGGNHNSEVLLRPPVVSNLASSARAAAHAKSNDCKRYLDTQFMLFNLKYYKYFTHDHWRKLTTRLIPIHIFSIKLIVIAGGLFPSFDCSNLWWHFDRTTAVPPSWKKTFSSTQLS